MKILVFSAPSQNLWVSEQEAERKVMMPIHELLNRMRWDKEFAKADFLIGYYDRLEKGIEVASLVKTAFC